MPHDVSPTNHYCTKRRLANWGLLNAVNSMQVILLEMTVNKLFKYNNFSNYNFIKRKRANLLGCSYKILYPY